ncbi:MAG: glycosyltransferase family 4 protein [Patescibacteria group bacterium]|nr:glycosyltransferase family 4 protein [Patescibacteria group bacterium]MDD4304272.1 glycosyltransferase family 4 protein [Patescibacteria group bacterium]MDD4695326.1 glycosyltransferase family 4 protein [Patescibacteria group bacterium]
MKLLICTQKVDKNDGVLGFFHNWIIEFTKHCEKVVVICLFQGEYDFPKNVEVLSLGKENGESRLKYIFRFYKYIWKYRKEYDNVFVHMNSEYVILGGIFWKFLNKKIYLWYVHKSKNIYLRIVNIFVKNIFTSSKESCLIKSKKIIFLGHGVDLNIFRKINIEKDKNLYKLLYVGRISPIKNLDILIEVFNILKKDSLINNLSLTIVGDVVYESDRGYLNNIKKKINDYKLNNYISFLGNIPIDKMSDIYNNHDLSINLSPTGGMDKTVLESFVCGVPCIVFNKAFKDVFGEYGDVFILDNLDTKELSTKIYNIYRNSNLEDTKRLLDLIQKDYNLSQLITNISNKINL